VTTEIVNADGAGPLDIAEQLDRALTRGLAVNLGAQIGFNSVWTQVIGGADRRASADDIARMRELIADGLRKGAWGVSAGLDYKPAYFAQGEEVIKVVEAARPFRTIFINHDRVTPESGFSSRAGMEETIAIGERAGVTPVITHMKVQGHEQGSADQILAKMQEATARGAYTAADAYPYLAGQTGLAALIIPGWAQDGGRDAMLKRFADPDLRARIVREAEAAMDKRFGGAAGIYLPATKRELTAVMRETNVSAVKPSSGCWNRAVLASSRGLASKRTWSRFFRPRPPRLPATAARSSPARPPIRATTARFHGCSDDTSASSRRCRWKTRSAR